MNSMSKFGIIVLAVVLSLGAAQARTFIDFNAPGISALTDVTTQYAAQGVTFSGVTDGGTTVNIEAFNDTYFYTDVNALPGSPNVLANYYGGSINNRAHIMQINFASPASGVSFEYNPAGTGTGVNTVFDVYNAAHTLVDSFSDPSATGDGIWYLETIPNADVSQVDIVSPQSGWGQYIDNLEFTEDPPNVPDSGTTLALLGTALAAMTGLRKKLS
jgi:hypothetical protein